MDYLKVLGFQIKVQLDCNSKNEYLIKTKELELATKRMQEIINEKLADIIILPEMCYQEDLYNYWKDLSKDKLIIAGSIYNEGENQTVIFSNNKSFFIPKCNASSAEPMVRFIEECSSLDFINKHLQEHIFWIKGRKVVILNCMEYYQNAYSIARSANNLFALICICSNNNSKVFKEETRAIHNHCENLYTFMVNCISTYKNKPYAKGESYVYGPIQRQEQDWLKKERVIIDDHCSSILNLSSEPEYFYGEFTNNFSRFGRSDEYKNNPKNIEIGKIKVKVKN